MEAFASAALVPFAPELYSAQAVSAYLVSKQSCCVELIVPCWAFRWPGSQPGGILNREPEPEVSHQLSSGVPKKAPHAHLAISSEHYRGAEPFRTAYCNMKPWWLKNTNPIIFSSHPNLKSRSRQVQENLCRNVADKCTLSCKLLGVAGGWAMPRQSVEMLVPKIMMGFNNACKPSTVIN